MNGSLPYDRHDPNDIERYAKELIGKRFSDIYVPEENVKRIFSSSGNKADLGQYLERFYFLHETRSSKDPCFEEAGVELKVIPLEESKKGEFSTKESIVLNTIDYFTIVEEDWDSSSFLHKNRLLLLVFYLPGDTNERLDSVIKAVTLWDYGSNDLEIIKQDWQKIVNKVREGKAHELSERETLYLGVCSMGVRCLSKRRQPFSDKLARQKSFSLKSSYVNSIVSRIGCVASVINARGELALGSDFEDTIVERFSKFQGLDVQSILLHVGKDLNPKAKSYYSGLAARMVGLSTDKIEEFERGDIIVKAIRLRKDGMPKESMSFPYFKYKEIVEETWETSTFLGQLDRRFFFMVFQDDRNNILRFKKVMFWAIPHSDLEEVREVWEETVMRIKNGMADNLPRIRDNRICHIRPHALNSMDTCETPQGEHLVKKSFWLNSTYIKEQIERPLFDTRFLS